MENFNFADYAFQFLKDKRLGDLPFYQNYTYKNLIESALSKSEELKKIEDNFFAVQVKSSYALFIYLLAGIFSHKNILILSSKEPIKAVLDYQKNLKFSHVFTDESLSASAPAELKTAFLIDMNQNAFTILSSGSSGPSKAITLSLNNVYHSAKSVIDFFHMTHADSTFLNLPHNHIGGLMILWRAFFSQSSITINEEDIYQFISLVPLQVKRMLDVPAKKKKLQDCRGVLIGGAPLSLELKSLLEDSHISYYETYGMSETSSLVMLNGRPLVSQEIKLDSEGHFLIKGPTLSSAVQVDNEGFFHTKDIGEEKNGIFSFKHRSDILFKSAGEMINPLLIESKLKMLPWIIEAVIVPIKHSEWTFASALVFKSSDATKTSQDLKDYLKTELHPHLVPKYFFEAPKDLFVDGMKPKRFEITNFAVEQYFKSLFHYSFLPAALHAEKLMVFFHGLMEDHTDMTGLIDETRHDISYLFIDLPGHGPTKASSFRDAPQVFSNLALLINFYKKELELILYGYSMGGRVAIEVAKELHPELLILESASFGLKSSQEKNLRLEADRKLFSTPHFNLKDFFHNWYKNPIFGNYNQTDQYSLAVEKKLTHSPKEWLASLEFFSPGAMPAVLEETLDALKNQNIVGIVGSDDVKYKTHYKEIASRLSRLHYIEIPKAAHNPHKTHLIELKAILKDIL